MIRIKLRDILQYNTGLVAAVEELESECNNTCNYVFTIHPDRKKWPLVEVGHLHFSKTALLWCKSVRFNFLFSLFQLRYIGNVQSRYEERKYGFVRKVLLEDRGQRW